MRGILLFSGRAQTRAAIATAKRPSRFTASPNVGPSRLGRVSACVVPKLIHQSRWYAPAKLPIAKNGRTINATVLPLPAFINVPEPQPSTNCMLKPKKNAPPTIAMPMGACAPTNSELFIVINGKAMMETQPIEINCATKPAGSRRIIVALHGPAKPNLKASNVIPSARPRIKIRPNLTPTNNDNKAIKNLSLDIFNGEILGIVGESGCGKSTLGKIICEILDKNSGEIFYRNKKISNLRKSNLDIQMVFQDPYSSLNPRKKVLDIIGEAAHVHKIVNKSEIKKYVSELMTSCGISPNLMNRYPHEFSGGQRQRIAIARALAVKPSLLICDEIVSALDVSIQAQILELINKLNKNDKLTIVFISHDLSVVNYISDRVAVMHLGEIVELDKSEKVFLTPSHSYTKALLANLPTIKDRNINYKPTLYTEE